MNRVLRVFLVLGFLLGISSTSFAARVDRAKKIVFGSNQNVKFVVNLNGAGRVTGGYHINRYTGRTWNIVSGTIRNGVLRNVKMIDRRTRNCDRVVYNRFVVKQRRNLVFFTRSRDRCGNQNNNVNQRFGLFKVKFR